MSPVLPLSFPTLRSSVRALLKRARDLTVEATDTARTAVGHGRHVARLPRLETHGRAGGNVEPKPARLRAIEVERAVRFGAVIVRADLNRSVAPIGDRPGERRAAGIELNLARLREDLSRNQSNTPRRTKTLAAVAPRSDESRVGTE